MLDFNCLGQDLFDMDHFINLKNTFHATKFISLCTVDFTVGSDEGEVDNCRRKFFSLCMPLLSL